MSQACRLFLKLLVENIHEIVTNIPSLKQNPTTKIKQREINGWKFLLLYEIVLT